jgi:hypothetical protein
MEIKKEELEAFAKWFNDWQWRGGKGDKLKSAFCACKYDIIVDEYLKQKGKIKDLVK